MKGKKFVSEKGQRLQNICIGKKIIALNQYLYVTYVYSFNLKAHLQRCGKKFGFCRLE